MKIFFISPVRDWDDLPEKERAAITAYVRALERDGHTVYWPRRDTDQKDGIGFSICSQNRIGIFEADAVHIWYCEDSTGSVFDLGMLFMLMWYKHIPLVLSNPEGLEPTPSKSFLNLVMFLSGHLDVDDPRLKA